GREVAADTLDDLDRRGGDALDEIHDERDRAAKRIGVAKARVEHQQGERQGGEEKQPDERRWTPLNERRGTVFHPPGAQSLVKIGPKCSIFSSALPEPRTTQVSGSSATLTVSPIS